MELYSKGYYYNHLYFCLAYSLTDQWYQENKDQHRHLFQFSTALYLALACKPL